MTRTRPRQRDSHIFVRDANDWYLEPHWCSAQLFDVEPFDRSHVLLDPCTGTGRIVAIFDNETELDAWLDDDGGPRVVKMRKDKTPPAYKRRTAPVTSAGAAPFMKEG